MSDFKSKLPDFKEITAMAGKFFTDVKKSICEIMDEYKKNHSDENTSPEDIKQKSSPVTDAPKKDKPTVSDVQTNTPPTTAPKQDEPTIVGVKKTRSTVKEPSQSAKPSTTTLNKQGISSSADVGKNDAPPVVKVYKQDKSPAPDIIKNNTPPVVDIKKPRKPKE